MLLLDVILVRIGIQRSRSCWFWVFSPFADLSIAARIIRKQRATVNMPFKKEQSSLRGGGLLASAT
jgi:hypothetical protein